ncbi:choice-of-anchor B family protein [Puniceicoccaceae bacterium K14]|nr:choice-of-anchor B family protein [Puniceicoccaceae bacterium K14]
MILQYAYSHNGDDYSPESDLDGLANGHESNSIVFPSKNLELLSHLSLVDMGGDFDTVRGNDIWGWTDPETNREYALFGRTDGVAFVDISAPRTPIFLGFLPKTENTKNSTWRDIKVYQNKAYIVADVKTIGDGTFNTNHGIQIFDLTILKNVESPPVIFSSSDHSDALMAAHNIAINEQTGTAIAMGVTLMNGNQGRAKYAFLLLDLNEPTSSPSFAPLKFDRESYTHDAQIVTYSGPDKDHHGKEIAFCSNDDVLAIIDLKTNQFPQYLSSTTYPQVGYIHQGWLTEDQRYFVNNDELDEQLYPGLIETARTHIWNVEDLDNPQYIGFHDLGLNTSDHNLFIHNNLLYEANYTAGIRVYDLTRIAEGKLLEVAHLDTEPAITVSNSFDGAWGIYPFFKSGTIIASDKFQGLIIGRLTDSLEIWRQENFQLVDLNNPDANGTLWGNLAAPDKDGLTNLQEFAIDSDPNSKTIENGISTSIRQFTSSSEPETMQSFQTISFIRRLDASFMSYNPEYSESLMPDSWQGGFEFVEYSEGPTENTRIETYRSTIPIEEFPSGQGLFLRLTHATAD